jgi:hypothetical protein
MKIDPMSLKVIVALDKEKQFRDQQQTKNRRRVKIEKPGQAWLVRFLPVELGEEGLPWIRLGQHWNRKQPAICPRCTATDFGGDPEFECPVCALADKLNDESQESVSNFGWRLRANVTYLTYCLVYQIDLAPAQIEEMELHEVLKPWEFQHYASSFQELHDYFRRGATEKRPWSVLDLESGNDFWATKIKGKGIRLDRQDSRPCLALDEDYEKNVNAIFKAIKLPEIKIPSVKFLENFASKAEDNAWEEADERRHSNRSERGERGERRTGDEASEYEDESDRQHHPVTRSGAPAKRLSRATPARGEDAEEAPNNGEPETEEEDQIPGAEAPPAKPPRPNTLTVSHPAARVPAPRPAPPAPPSRMIRSGTAAPQPAAKPPGGVRPPAPRAASALKPVVKPPSARAPRPLDAESSVNDEEDPGVAEEAVDQAQMAEQELAAEAEQGQEQAASENEPEPDDRSGLRQRLIRRISKTPKRPPEE